MKLHWREISSFLLEAFTTSAKVKIVTESKKRKLSERNTFDFLNAYPIDYKTECIRDDYGIAPTELKNDNNN